MLSISLLPSPCWNDDLFDQIQIATRVPTFKKSSAISADPSSINNCSILGRTIAFDQHERTLIELGTP